MTNRTFILRLWLTLAAYWLLILPLGIWSPVPVVAATIVCGLAAAMVPAALLIWDRP